LSKNNCIGPYAAAILRFRVAITTKYPVQPPSITFTSEVFHPLVTPSTTYSTTTTSSSSSVTDGIDTEQLPAGGLSLRYGFPNWYEKVAINVTTPKPAEVSAVLLEPSDCSECDSDEHLIHGISRTSESKRLSSDEDDSLSRNPNPKPAPWTISDVLHYLKRVFEDEDLLDTLPLELAVNQGAWKAWRAYRTKSKRTSFRSQADQNGSPSKVPKSRLSVPATAGPSMDWNWEGVWVKRVKAMVNASTSDPILYAGYDNDETVSEL
jgi:hypothetical protein